MSAPADTAGRIGPNAITRVAEALPLRIGPEGTHAVFAAAGLLHHLHSPPQTMVDELEVQRLHASLRAHLGEDAAAAVSRDAGTRTANYLLAHRIPRAVQALLRLLPAALAARVLLAAIGRNAWTFAGSGRFRVEPGQPTRLWIHDNPLCRGLQRATPACDYYAATFEHLFRVLVHRRASVREVSCEARGDPGCCFELRWSSAGPPCQSIDSLGS